MDSGFVIINLPQPKYTTITEIRDRVTNGPDVKLKSIEYDRHHIWIYRYVVRPIFYYLKAQIPEFSYSEFIYELYSMYVHPKDIEYMWAHAYAYFNSIHKKYDDTVPKVLWEMECHCRAIKYAVTLFLSEHYLRPLLHPSMTIKAICESEWGVVLRECKVMTPYVINYNVSVGFYTIPCKYIYDFLVNKCTNISDVYESLHKIAKLHGLDTYVPKILKRKEAAMAIVIQLRNIWDNHPGDTTESYIDSIVYNPILGYYFEETMMILVNQADE